MRNTSPLLLALLLVSACSNDPSIVGHPARLSLALASPALYFERGYELAVVATVEDLRGTPLYEEVVVFEVDAPERAELVSQGVQDAAYALHDTGTVRVTGCAESLATLCDSLLVTIDDGSPVLVVDTPMPGDEVDGPDGITVHGSVIDATSTLSVFVNGAQVERAADGTFATTVPARFGVEHLDILATDLLSTASRTEFDVLWAPAFTPATDVSGAPAVTLDDALLISLGQLSFDDGQSFVDTNPVRTEDLADIVEAVLLRADVSGVVPDPVFDSGGLFLRLLDPALDDPHVEVSVQDDGIDLYIRLGRITGTTAGSLTIGSDVFDLAGSLSAGASVYARLTVTKPSRDAEVVVALTDFEVAVDTIDGTFVDPEVDAIFALATGLLRTTLEDQIRAALDSLLTSSIPSLLAGVFSGIDHALENTTVALDQAPLPAVTLTLDGRIGRILPTYRDQLIAELSLAVSSGSTNLHPDSLGVARIADAAASPGVFHDGEVQIGVQLGLMNGVLHVLWSSGLLDLDASTLIPSSFASVVSSATLAAKLPPVVRPARDDEAADAIFTLGQLELHIESPAGTHRFGVRIELPIEISLVDSRFAIGFPTDPVFTLWVIEEPEEPGLITLGVLRPLLEGLWPTLAGSLTSGLALELPIPPLTALTAIAPTLDGFTLGIDETSTTLHPRGEWLILDAALVGATP